MEGVWTVASLDDVYGGIPRKDKAIEEGRPIWEALGVADELLRGLKDVPELDECHRAVRSAFAHLILVYGADIAPDLGGTA
jgi:hypothetical protein